jgi:hypothetical protein
MDFRKRRLGADGALLREDLQTGGLELFVRYPAGICSHRTGTAPMSATRQLRISSGEAGTNYLMRRHVALRVLRVLGRQAGQPQSHRKVAAFLALPGSIMYHGLYNG